MAGASLIFKRRTNFPLSDSRWWLGRGSHFLKVLLIFFATLNNIHRVFVHIPVRVQWWVQAPPSKQMLRLPHILVFLQMLWLHTALTGAKAGTLHATANATNITMFWFSCTAVAHSKCCKYCKCYATLHWQTPPLC